jgi:hypothetical protein
MKAEQRKQLETNVLADRMGRLMQNLKKRPSRRGMWIWVAVIAAVVIGGGLYLYRSTQSRVDSDLWAAVLDGLSNRETINRFFNITPSGISPKADVKETPQGRVMRFDLAWDLLWQEGILSLYRTDITRGTIPAADPAALERIRQAREMYKTLYDETKSDKVLGPEALYSVAVAEETLAIEKIDNLKMAKDTYAQVVKEFDGSSFAKQAAERLKVLRDPEGYRQVERFYQELNEAYTLHAGSQLDSRKKIEELLKQLKAKSKAK